MIFPEEQHCFTQQLSIYRKFMNYFGNELKMKMSWLYPARFEISRCSSDFYLEIRKSMLK